ncbi:MAG: DUF5916 domain-containing protein [Bacteroidales bacterium]|jgi:hypothetical protein
MRKLLTLVLAVFLVSGIAVCQEAATAKRQYQAVKLKQQVPVIDGRLDETLWQTIEKGGQFIEFEPYEGHQPSQKTEFAITYDDNNLYVAYWALDSSPDSISRRLTRRDEIDGDMVGINIDSYYDKRTAFGFFVSASGVKMDMLTSNDGMSEDKTWDPNWYAATAINDQGWTAEMRIPLSQLRFSDKENRIWGIEVYRLLFRKGELSQWQIFPRTAPGSVHLFGELTGISDIKPRRQVDVTPYAVVSGEKFEKEEGNPYATGKDFKYSGGLDAKIGVTNNLTVDLSVNPDFGQVEADPSEVNLTAFETFFAEKRPFFVEGRNILSMPLMLGDGDLANENLFYTRRVGRRPQLYPSLRDGEYARVPEFSKILGAAKISGRTENGWSVGLLESVTAEEKAEIDYNGEKRTETVEPLTNYLIGTLRKDMNDGNTVISGMVTSTNRKLDATTIDQLHSGAYSAGVDFTQYFKDKTYMLMVKSYISQVTGTPDVITQTQMSSARYYQRPDADHLHLDTTRTSLFGNGGTLFFGKLGNAPLQWGWFLSWKTPGVEINDVGYMRSADNILPIFWAGYRFTKPFWIFRSVSLNTNHWTGFDLGLNYQGYGGNINANASFKNMWELGAGLNWDTQTIETSLLRGGPAFQTPSRLAPWIYIGTDQRKKLSLNLNGYGNRYAEGHASMKGLQVSLNYKPINALSISVSPNFTSSYSNLQYIEQNSYGSEPRYIFGSINQTVLGVSLRINLTLTPTLTIQYWGQPFMASGLFSDLKYITNPMADTYSDRYHVYTAEQLSCFQADGYCDVDENMDKIADYTISYPDFNVKEFKSNLVVRWEYRPGSVVFLVWSQGRSGYDAYGDFSFGRDFKSLTNIQPRDILLVKFSYRFGL